jgi:AbrB family looped-hinge helix DNA binding protein
MTTVTVSSRGQLVIPKALREEYHLKAKTKVACIDTGRGLFLVPIAGDPVQATRGVLKGGLSLTQALVEERRRDRAFAERKFQRWLP